MAKLEITFRGLCAIVADRRVANPGRVTVVLIDVAQAGHRRHRATVTFAARDFQDFSVRERDFEVLQAPGGKLLSSWTIEGLEFDIGSTGRTLGLENLQLIDEEIVGQGIVDGSCRLGVKPERPIAARLQINRGLVFCHPDDPRDPRRSDKVEVVRLQTETAGNEVVLRATIMPGAAASAQQGTLRLQPRSSGDTVFLTVSNLPSVRHLGEDHNSAYQSLLRDRPRVAKESEGACIPRQMFEI